MRDTIWTMRKTFMTTFRKTSSWFVYVGLPIAGILLALLGSGGDNNFRLIVGIVNHDLGQQLTLDMKDHVARMDGVQVQDVEPAELNEQVTDGALGAAILFPQGFAEGLRNGEQVTVEVVSIAGADVTRHLRTYLNEYIRKIALIGRSTGGDQLAFDQMYADYQSSDYSMRVETVQDRSIDYSRTTRSIGYLLILMLFSAATLSNILIKEKENRTYFRLMSTPLSARSYVASNIIVNLFVLTLQIIITLLVMTQLFHIDLGIPIWSLFLILVAYLLVAISIAMVIAVMSNNSNQAMAWQNVVFLPSSMLAGCMFSIEGMPAVMQRMAHFMPQRWVLDAIDKLHLGQATGQILLDVLILLAFAVTFSLLSLYIYSRNDDTRKYV